MLSSDYLDNLITMKEEHELIGIIDEKSFVGTISVKDLKLVVIEGLSLSSMCEPLMNILEGNGSIDESSGTVEVHHVL
jgi:hypothetical protein